MRVLAFVIALLVAVGGGAYFWTRQSGLQVSISRAQLQERVDARLPFTGERGPLQYTVARAALDLRANGRIGIDADVVIGVFNQNLAAEIVGSGVLTYREGEFFVSEAVVEDVTIAPREDKQPGGPRLKQLLQQGARAFGSQALKQVEDEVRRHGGTILNAVLEKQPVYKLRAGDTKHDLARLVLDKIEVREQTLLATLNPFRK